jgi:uncharacterized membrane protein YagU involved in acid resistance
MASAIAESSAVGTSVNKRVAGGALGGLIGGIVFGIMMQMMDMIPMVAMLVGSESVAVGWAVHLSISVILGIGFGLVAVKGLDGWGSGLGLGIAYGVVWWVLGALVAMPVRLGMPAFDLSAMAWRSLMGHVIFGAILGLVTVAVVRREATSR